MTQSRSILFHKLEHLKSCALLTGTLKDSQGQSNNILQVAAQNAGAAGQNLQPLTIFLFHPSHLYYTFPVSHMILRSRSAVKHNRSCSALLVSARSLNLAPLWSWAFTSPVSYSKSGGLLSKFEAHFNRIRNCRRKMHHSRLPAQTLSRNVCWKMGNYGNVIAAMPHPGSWTNMHKGWGLQLRIVWAAELEVRETMQHKLTGGRSWNAEGWMIHKDFVTLSDGSWNS